MEVIDKEVEENVNLEDDLHQAFVDMLFACLKEDELHSFTAAVLRGQQRALSDPNMPESFKKLIGPEWSLEKAHKIAMNTLNGTLWFVSFNLLYLYNQLKDSTAFSDEVILGYGLLPLEGGDLERDDYRHINNCKVGINDFLITAGVKKEFLDAILVRFYEKMKAERADIQLRAWGILRGDGVDVRLILTK